MAYYFSPLGNGVAFVDSNGNPLSGAKLFTYTAGSTTKSTVYQTNAGTAHANPMTLDANGRPPAAIWLEGGRSYKFVLAPSTDTDPPASAIYTWDNVSGINDTAISVDQWVSGPTPTFVDADTFTLVGDQSSTFHVNRRLKLTVSGGTRYGYVSAVAYTTLTTVDVVLDSGTLDSGLSAVSYALLSATNQSYPRNIATTDTAQTFSAVKTFSANPVITGNALSLRPPNSTDNVHMWLQNETGTNQGLLFWSRSDDTVRLRRYNSAGSAAEGEIVIGASGGAMIGTPTGGDKGAGTVNASGYFINGAPISYVIDRDVTSVTVSNSTTETSVYSFTVAGGTLSTNRMIRVTLLAVSLNNTGSAAHNMYIKFKYGGVTFADLNLSHSTAAATEKAVIAVSELSGKNATNAQIGHTDARMSATLPVAAANAAIETQRITSHPYMTVDSTVNQTLEITAQFTAADPNLYITVHSVQVELV